MENVVRGGGGMDIVDLRRPIGDNLRALAKASGKKVGDLAVGVLDRPRHEGLIAEIRAAGAGVRLLLDGDVGGGIAAASLDGDLDMCVGIGGSPEGVATACAVKALGGLIQGRLVPSDDVEREKGAAAGLEFDRVYEANDLVRGENTFFVATGVTDGALLEGVRKLGPVIRTESIVVRGRSGTVRRITADYRAERWV